MKAKLFALSTCPYCRMTKQYLDDKGVAYDLVEVDKLEGQEKADAIEEVRKLSGGTSFPVIVMGDEVIVGFNKSKIEKLVEA